MTKYEIIFAVNNAIKIIIPLRDPIEQLGPISIEKILLLFNNRKVLLSNTAIYHNMLGLTDLLKKALKQKNFLFSTTKDIGYFHNEYLYESVNISTPIIPTNSIDWKGYNYHLWSARNNFASFSSWIYNAPDGAIIFEVTPIYPYLFSEPEEEPDYVPYEEWIKTYKPYFITTLSREIAEQWLEQAEHIIKIVERNQRRWELRSKRDVGS